MTEAITQDSINVKEAINSLNPRRIYPENILDQKTGEQFAEASRMFAEANESLIEATTDDTYAQAVLGFASGYLLQPKIVEIERSIFNTPKGNILRDILHDKERIVNLYNTEDEELNHTIKIAAHILLAFEEFSHLNSLSNVPKNMLGKIGNQIGEMIINSAVKSWDDVIAIEGSNSLFWYMKGEVFGIIGRPEDALNCFRKGLAINEVDYRSAFGIVINSPIHTLKPKVVQEVNKALNTYIKYAPICDENMSHACFLKMVLLTGMKLNTETWKEFLAKDDNKNLLEKLINYWKKGFQALIILERWYPSRIDYQLYKRAIVMMDEMYKEKLLPKEGIEGVHVCDFCGKNVNGKLFKCTGCNVVYYCSKEHQKVHWQKHKNICKQLK